MIASKVLPRRKPFPPRPPKPYSGPLRGFSKKWENLEAAYALWFAYYNFCRVHQTLKVTPAMESGLAGSVWELKDLIAA